MTDGRQTDGISICITNWNHRNYLSRSVGSALRAAELFANRGLGCQVLVVDDFSRDGSQRVLAAMCFVDRTGALDVILSPKNGGVCWSRNMGLQNARYRHAC